MTPMTDSTTPTAPCRNCGAAVVDINGHHDVWKPGTYFQGESGLCLDLTGHYGGFFDKLGDDMQHVVLCHDCSLGLARALPGIFKSSIGQAHPAPREADEVDGRNPPCCEYSWTLVKIRIAGDDENEPCLKTIGVGANADGTGWIFDEEDL
jgi:hypothetical protein